MTIRAASSSDAAAITEIIRAPFDPAIVETFIYGCSGIARYIAATIDERGHEPDTRYYVAGDPIQGAIEMRILPDALFLNYIAIDGSARGQHLGTRLLGHAIDDLAQPAHERFALDVLETNDGARAWYAKLGMMTVSRATWYVGELLHAAAGPATIAGLPQARLCHRELGFSRFSVSCAHGVHDIGMLGDRWFRLTSARAVTDHCVVAALHRLDPARRILAILEEDAQAPPSLERFVTMERMSASLAVVRAALSMSLAGGA